MIFNENTYTGTKDKEEAIEIENEKDALAEAVPSSVNSGKSDTAPSSAELEEPLDGNSDGDKSEKPHFATDICLIAVAFVYMLSGMTVTLCRYSATASEFFCSYPSGWLRTALAYMTSIFPFSLCESFAVILPLLIIYGFISKSILERKEGKCGVLNNYLKKVLCLILAFAAITNLGFNVLYTRKPVNEYVGLERKDITASELADTYQYVTDRMNSLVEDGKISFATDGFSVMPFSFDELGEKVNAAYALFIKRGGYDFLTPLNVKAKPLLCSGLMTYTHLSGIYTSPTGESNVNTNYPDYVVAYTYAHELAHQRGVAPEDDANFIAFLVLLESDDAYLNYCAYRYVSDYLQSSLYIADSDRCLEILYSTDKLILKESVAYSAFFDRYRDNAAADIAETVNDTSLKLKEEKAGTQSYGMVVDLVTAYVKDIKGTAQG